MANECMAPAHISRCFGGVCGWCKQSEVTRLTRERGEARVRLAVSRGCRKVAKDEVTRLTEALAAAEQDKLSAEAQTSDWKRSLEAAESRVRELEELLDMAGTGKGAAESECAALRAELAASKRVQAKAEEHLEMHRTEDPHIVSELRHELWQRNSECKALSQDRHELRARLAAANALLERAYPHCPDAVTRDIDAHLAAQPVRERAEAAESECAALRAEVERLTALYQQERDAHDRLLEEAEDYSSKCQTLRTERDNSRRNADAWCEKQYAAESRLAAANALIRAVFGDEVDIENMAWIGWGREDWARWGERALAHLAAQPATAPARDELAELRERVAKADTVLTEGAKVHGSDLRRAALEALRGS